MSDTAITGFTVSSLDQTTPGSDLIFAALYQYNTPQQSAD
jgi:hypothetical protein